MVPVLDNLYHRMQNILLDNLLYDYYFITTQKNSYRRLTVLKPHQFDNKFCCLLKRHGQCTWKTILHNIIKKNFKVWCNALYLLRK